MDELSLDVRLDGHADPVGVLVRDRNGGLAFAYRPDYLSDPDATLISMSLPLTPEPFGDEQTRPFFDNLLQERDGALADIMAREGIARDDVAGLLFHLGKDCAGALSILPRGSPPVRIPGDYARDYIPLEPERLRAIVASLHTRGRLPEDMRDPSPLAGVQSKIALTLLPDGRLAEPLPGSGAPTTHILKVPDQTHLRDARLEAEAMELSRSLGIDTADTVVVPVAGIDALLATRFDRALDRDGRIVRVHQEDFAQALGLPPSLKYERRGTEERRFDTRAIRRVLEATSDPAFEKDRFIRATLFDLLVGNADGHAKNLALLFEGRRRIRMAPRYDILPTRLDPNLTDELAYRIGDARTIGEVTVENFDRFLHALGIESAAAKRRIRSQHMREMTSALADRLESLGRSGMKPFADLVASNIRLLAGNLAVPVPDAAKERDAYVGRAGGWLLS